LIDDDSIVAVGQDSVSRATPARRNVAKSIPPAPSYRSQRGLLVRRLTSIGTNASAVFGSAATALSTAS
jgi:hypothetical protein